MRPVVGERELHHLLVHVLAELGGYLLADPHPRSLEQSGEAVQADQRAHVDGEHGHELAHGAGRAEGAGRGEAAARVHRLPELRGSGPAVVASHAGGRGGRLPVSRPGGSDNEDRVHDHPPVVGHQVRRAGAQAQQEGADGHAVAVRPEVAAHEPQQQAEPAGLVVGRLPRGAEGHVAVVRSHRSVRRVVTARRRLPCPCACGTAPRTIGSPPSAPRGGPAPGSGRPSSRR